MPAPRKPLSVARASGATQRNPARFTNRADPATVPLGGPPDWLTPHGAQAWALFRAELPWLTECDRAVVELGATIRGRVLAGEAVGVQALNLLRQVLGQMGATPADRSRIMATPSEADPVDPAAKYLS